LGTPDLSHRQPTTAVNRAASYLETLAGVPSDPQRQGAELLARRDQLVNHYRDLTRDITEDLDRSSSRGREHDNAPEL